MRASFIHRLCVSICPEYGLNTLKMGSCLTVIIITLEVHGFCPYKTKNCALLCLFLLEKIRLFYLILHSISRFIWLFLASVSRAYIGHLYCQSLCWLNFGIILCCDSFGNINAHIIIFAPNVHDIIETTFVRFLYNQKRTTHYWIYQNSNHLYKTSHPQNKHRTPCYYKTASSFPYQIAC